MCASHSEHSKYIKRCLTLCVRLWRPNSLRPFWPERPPAWRAPRARGQGASRVSAASVLSAGGQHSPGTRPGSGEKPLWGGRACGLGEGMLVLLASRPQWGWGWGGCSDHPGFPVCHPGPWSMERLTSQRPGSGQAASSSDPHRLARLQSQDAPRASSAQDPRVGGPRKKWGRPTGLGPQAPVQASPLNTHPAVCPQRLDKPSAAVHRPAPVQA